MTANITNEQTNKLVPPENRDVAEHNFRVFAQPCNFCHEAQLGLILALGKLGKFGGKFESLSTYNLSFLKFEAVAVCPKIVTSCLHTFFTLDATRLD